MSKVTAIAKVREAKAAEVPQEKVLITPPKFKYAKAQIKGTAPFMSNAMSSEARRKMKEGQEQGSANRGMKRKRDPKDFNAQFKGSLHISRDGWYGIPCSAFRGAMIEACKTVGFPMTRAKLFLFIEPEGRDKDTGEGLVRIHGTPVQDERIGKLATGVADILTRGRFDEWTAEVHLKWDSDALTATDVLNLLARAGTHVGVGAGRPGSSNSAGIGMGTFVVEN
jgi:hypothetical protein